MGWNALVGNGDMFVAVLAHEAAHLYQMHQGMTRERYDAAPEHYVGEATRIAEEYLKRLGYDQSVLDAARRYSMRLE